MEEDHDLVSVQEFADQYRVDASVVRSWVKQGIIEYVLVGPRKMKRIRKSDVVKPFNPGDSNNGNRGPNPKSSGGGKETGATGNANGSGGAAAVKEIKGRGRGAATNPQGSKT